jgi:hypothetical protein
MFAGETSKARERRLREGWFELFAPEQLNGIDIGCQHDPLNHYLSVAGISRLGMEMLSS